MKYSDWSKEMFEELENDPDYIAAGLMIEINEQIFTRMQELQVSQTELAKRIGKSQPYVSKLLNDGSNMTLKTIAKLSLALDLDVMPPVFKPKGKPVESYSNFVVYRSNSCRVISGCSPDAYPIEENYMESFVNQRGCADGNEQAAA